MLFSRLSAIYALWLVVLSANAAYNVTVEPSDTSMLQYHPTSCLSYDGEWQIKEDSGFRDGVGYFCDAPGSTVTFTFVGIIDSVRYSILEGYLLISWAPQESPYIFFLQGGHIRSACVHPLMENLPSISTSPIPTPRQTSAEI
jgi:hypothetical protein